MLLLVEYDFVLGSQAARSCFTDFMARHPTVSIAIFRSSSVAPDVMIRSYPDELRKRALLTPFTPRNCDMGYWLTYEVGCVTSALRNNGAMGQNERWLMLVPPNWAQVTEAQFGRKRLVVIPTAFNDEGAKRLRMAFASGQWGHTLPSQHYISLFNSRSLIAC